MRYLPMIFSAGLLLSVGLLAGSGPATPPCPRSHWIVPLSQTRRSKRLPTLPPTLSPFLSPWLLRPWIWLWLPTPILRLWLPTALLWLWIWASLALLREQEHQS